MYAASDIRGKHRTEPVPPKTYSFVADIVTTHEQYIFDRQQ
jgi:hypothetical protein